MNTTDTALRSDPFGFDPGHVVDMRVEMASDSDELPVDWPCEIVRRAAKLMKERAEAATKGRWWREDMAVCATGSPYLAWTGDGSGLIDEQLADAEHIAAFDPDAATAVADAWGHQADDMCDCLAHFHAFGPPGSWVVEDERESVHWDWTATVRAALAYLREDAPAVNV